VHHRPRPQGERRSPDVVKVALSLHRLCD
jgi:hypothetical protein